MSRLTRFSSLSLCIASSLLALVVGLTVGDLLLPHPTTASAVTVAAVAPVPVPSSGAPDPLFRHPVPPRPTTTTTVPKPVPSTSPPTTAERPQVVRAAPVTTVAPRPVVTAPAAPVASSSGSLAADFACIARYESGDTNDDTGNGYYGYFQFSYGTWASYSGLPGTANDYSYGTQLAVAEKVEESVGWGAWPNTSRMCGL